jgi:hypothetical protein
MIGYRKSKGNVIFLVSLLIGIILVVVIGGMGFNQLLFMRARAEYEADAKTLSLASKINRSDRIGELNQLQEASRELIFVSRQDCQWSAAGRVPDFIGLSDQLLENARSGHSIVETERENQILSIRKQIQDEIVAYNHARTKGNIYNFFGLQVFQPEILSADLGHIAKVNSNVRTLGAIPELTAYDLHKAYVDKRTKLFTSDVNAKLSDPDTDLNFDFSSLPAYIGKTEAPARNTNADVFVSYGTIFSDEKIRNASLKQIPSAIQIRYGMDIAVPWDQSKLVPIRLVSTGSASGASSDSSDFQQ